MAIITTNYNNNTTHIDRIGILTTTIATTPITITTAIMNTNVEEAA